MIYDLFTPIQEVSIAMCVPAKSVIIMKQFYTGKLMSKMLSICDIGQILLTEIYL